MKMDAKQMSAYLGLDGTKDGPKILAAMTPEEWKEHEDFADVDFAIQLWDKGLGPLPPGVIACRGKRGHRHD